MFPFLLQRWPGLPLTLIIFGLQQVFFSTWARVIGRSFAFAVIALAACSQSLAQTPVFSAQYVSDGSGNAGASTRQVVPHISSGGTKVRVTILPAMSGAFSVSRASICVQAGGATCVAQPIELTFSGASGFGLAANGAPAISDWASLTTSAGQSLLIVMDVTTSAISKNGTGPPGFTSYWASGTSWNNQSPGGTWSSVSTIYGISLVEVMTPGPPTPPAVVATGLAGGGRLTIVRGQPRITSDTVAAFVDYAPDAGTTIPMVDASLRLQWALFTASPGDAVGLTLNLDASWVSNGIYDVYAANAGNPTLCTGPQRQPPDYIPVQDALYWGVRVNAVEMPCRASPFTTITCPQYQCTLLGTIKISPTAGLVRCDFSYGQNRECGVWNAHNQVDLVLQAGNREPLSGGQFGNGAYYFSTSWGPLHGDGGNALNIVIGRPGHTAEVRLLRRGRTNFSAFNTGIGWNSTTVPSGHWGGFNAETFSNTAWFGAGTLALFTSPATFQGGARATALEQAIYGNVVGWVTPTDVLLEARYKH